MAQFRLDYEVELEKAPIRIELPVMFEGDASAHVIGALVKDHGQTVELNGDCTGIVLLADGTKVSRTGSVSGNRAYFSLSSGCYAVPGIIRLFLSYETTDDKITLIEASGIIREV